MSTTEPADVVTLDVESLTFGELCDIEDAVGSEAASTLLSPSPSPKAVTAAIWISKRRTYPDLSFDDVKAMKVTSVEFA